MKTTTAITRAASVHRTQGHSGSRHLSIPRGPKNLLFPVTEIPEIPLLGLGPLACRQPPHHQMRSCRGPLCLWLPHPGSDPQDPAPFHLRSDSNCLEALCPSLSPATCLLCPQPGHHTATQPCTVPMGIPRGSFPWAPTRPPVREWRKTRRAHLPRPRGITHTR